MRFVLNHGLNRKTQLKKKLFYSSVNVFHESTNWDTIFTSANGDGTAIFRGHPNHTNV